MRRWERLLLAEGVGLTLVTLTPVAAVPVPSVTSVRMVASSGGSSANHSVNSARTRGSQLTLKFQSI